jgi:hypothetical protein
MSVKLNIWNAVKAKLTELKTAKSINHFAIWNNQINQELNEIPFEFPAVFMEFTEMSWKTGIEPERTTQYNKQMSEDNWIVSFHICFENYEAETSSFEINDPKMDIIIEALQLLPIDQFATNLIRINEVQDTEHGNVIHWIVSFATAVQETFANDTVTDATSGDPTKLSLIINTDIDV